MPAGVDVLVAGQSRQRTIAVVGLSAMGFALTLYVFYPGVMTLDARYVYNDIAKGFLGDWQSPAMTVLWALIDPIAPGAASMFLLIASLYWLAFALIGISVARKSWLAMALPLLALSPPAFMLAGIIWRDVLFAAVWLLAAAVVFACGGRAASARRPIQALALVLLAFGVLLRPNAIPAAPLLAAYIVWPRHWRLKHVAIAYVPIFVALAALVPIIYYSVMGATRQHPLHALLVFDLGGISHFSKQNQFPVAWPPSEDALVTGGCYRPDKWDGYWYLEPCKFVMARLEGDKIFGTPIMVEAWRRAVLNHPVAYFKHRAAFMSSFLTGANIVMWTQDIDRPTEVVFADRPAFVALRTLHDALLDTWLFKPASWLVLCVALCTLGWRRRETPAGAFIAAICGSGALFIASYFFLGVASDYRYSYWAVLAGVAGGVVLIAEFFTRELSSEGR
jgi:hypothetical protein